MRRQVAVIAATGGPASGQAAKAATATIPIVFLSGADPVHEGLVASLNRPGGNATGVNPLLPAMEGKRLGLLREVVPNAALIGVLANPATPFFDRQVNDVQETARRVGQQVHILRASNDENIEAAFATMAELRAGALLVCADPFMLSRRERLVALAARHTIPAIYEVREYAIAGGLMSYGVSLATPGAFSRAKGRQSCRFCSRPSSSWSLTSRLLRQSASKSPTICSRCPTR